MTRLLPGANLGVGTGPLLPRPRKPGGETAPPSLGHKRIVGGITFEWGLTREVGNAQQRLSLFLHVREVWHVRSRIQITGPQLDRFFYTHISA